MSFAHKTLLRLFEEASRRDARVWSFAEASHVEDEILLTTEPASTVFPWPGLPIYYSQHQCCPFEHDISQTLCYDKV